MKKSVFVLMAIAAMVMTGCVPATNNVNFSITNQSGRVVCVATGTVSGQKFNYVDYQSLGAGSSAPSVSLDVPKSGAKIFIIVCKDGMAVQTPDPNEALANRDPELCWLNDAPAVVDGGKIVIVVNPDGKHEVHAQ